VGALRIRGERAEHLPIDLAQRGGRRRVGRGVVVVQIGQHKAARVAQLPVHL